MAMIIQMPFGKETLPISIPDERILTIPGAPDLEGVSDPAPLVERALDRPDSGKDAKIAKRDQG